MASGVTQADGQRKPISLDDRVGLENGTEPMRAKIDHEAVNGVLHGEVLKLPIMVRIVLMENRDGAAVARRIDAIQSGIKTDYIRCLGHRQERNRLVFIKIKDGHQVVAFA